METKIVKLLESSIVLAARCTMNRTNGTNSAELKSSLAEALNKAKDASSLDRILHHEQDKQGENVFHNFDLTYAVSKVANSLIYIITPFSFQVFFNLAEQYEHNDMHIEALNTYNIMTKNKMFPHVNQLKLNMGNIYLKMGMHKKAIKMYRMALDSVPNTQKQLRLRITENIGVLFVRMGQYADAASSFEFIMSERPDIRSGIHLLLCYYAMGDVEKIKSTFRSLCDVQPVETERDLENENNIIRLQQQAEQAGQTTAETHAAEVAIIDGEGNSSFVQVNEPSNGSGNAKNRYVLQALKTDELAVYTKNRRNTEKRSITMIVDLISPLIEENYNDGTFNLTIIK